MPPEALEFLAGRKDAEFHAPKGCAECMGTGYHGRTTVYEILLMDERLRELVAAGAGVRALREAAIAGGMRTMLVNGLEKAARGITSIEEVVRVVPHGTDV